MLERDDVDFQSVEGHISNIGSVAYSVDRAYRVVFDKNMETGEDMSYMTHKPTKKTYRFRRERNVVDAASVNGVFSWPE